MYIFSSKGLSGNLQLPPSKSFLHRYIIASSISRQKIILNGVNQICDDIKTTINIMSHVFGTIFEFKKNRLFISPGLIKNNKRIFFFQESATTLRICFPMILHKFGYIYLFTNKSLSNRTIWTYLNLLDIAEFKSLYKNSEFPMYVKGKILAKDYILEESISSQFISGLLFSLPLLEKNSTIKLKNPVPSLGYIKLSIEVLNRFNIYIEHNKSFDFFKIPGRQKYKSSSIDFTIEEDLSSRSYWEICNIVNKNNNIILNPIKKSFQPDMNFISKIQTNSSIIDIKDMPDCAILCCIYLTKMHKKGIIKGIKRLKYKESNRLSAIIDILNRSSVNYVIKEDYLIIKNGFIKNGFYNTFNDHRVAMSLIIITAVFSNTVIKLEEINSVNKSYPGFIEDFLKLGGSMING